MKVVKLAANWQESRTIAQVEKNHTTTLIVLNIEIICGRQKLLVPTAKINQEQTEVNTKSTRKTRYILGYIFLFPLHLTFQAKNKHISKPNRVSRSLSRMFKFDIAFLDWLINRYLEPYRNSEPYLAVENENINYCHDTSRTTE